MKTYNSKPAEVSRKWYVIDASSASLGRVASEAAKLLIGKHKVSYTPHNDDGDFVIVINSAKLIASGKKMDDKIYYRHSGYPGGLHSRTLSEQIEINPDKVIARAVRGMLPDNKLRSQRLGRLKVYPTETHNHAAQLPENFELSKGGK